MCAPLKANKCLLGQLESIWGASAPKKHLRAKFVPDVQKNSIASIFHTLLAKHAIFVEFFAQKQIEVDIIKILLGKLKAE